MLKNGRIAGKVLVPGIVGDNFRQAGTVRQDLRPADLPVFYFLRRFAVGDDPSFGSLEIDDLPLAVPFDGREVFLGFPLLFLSIFPMKE